MAGKHETHDDCSHSLVFGVDESINGPQSSFALRRSNAEARKKSRTTLKIEENEGDYDVSGGNPGAQYTMAATTKRKPRTVPMFEFNEEAVAALAHSADLDPHGPSYEPSWPVDPELLGIGDGYYGLHTYDYPTYTLTDPHANTRDWSFLHKEEKELISSTSASSMRCPSLATGSTVSSRNSSTRSSKSIRWHGAESICELNELDTNQGEQMCPMPNCGQAYTNLRNHLIHHSDVERPEKCPVRSCQYYVRGFARAYDRARHTNTHFTGTFFCGFCPRALSGGEKTFSRQDTFSRHLVSTHGAEQLPPYRLKELHMSETIVKGRPPLAGSEIATCTLCSEPFDAQGFYEHLPGCVLRHATREAANSINDKSWHVQDSHESRNSPRNDSVVTPNNLMDDQPAEELLNSEIDREASPVPSSILVPCIMQQAEDAFFEENHFHNRDQTIEELTDSSRCLSLTSSSGARSSDEETDWTEESLSPESDTEAVRVQPVLSPIKRQMIDQIMQEFHRLFDQQMSDIRTCHGESSSGTSQKYTASNKSLSGDSPHMSRKRSLSGGGSRPPNDDRNGGDDHHKRRRPDSRASGKNTSLELRFACPYYKRNPGRHQTFTSCRDPGFITVARLKEHLYRRHLLPISCHRCCSTFANEPLLREHQRDPLGCEIQEQIPLEGFDKDQERKLKSKKRSLVHQTEEEKWKCVYNILFPDDNVIDMPSPYIEYQACNPTTSQSSNIAHFQEFSRLELPRLVRRTLEVVIEQEAQPLEDKLKERLVDIVKECQTQLISMFQRIDGTTDSANATETEPSPEIPQESSQAPTNLPFHGFDSSYVTCSTSEPSEPSEPIRLLMAEYECVQSDPSLYEHQNTEKPPSGDRNSGSPDSGYDSTWTAVGFPQEVVTFEAPFVDEYQYGDFDILYGLDRNVVLDTTADPSVWPYIDIPFTENSSLRSLESGAH